jgi:phosphonate transport system substrate-binding protein
MSRPTLRFVLPPSLGVQKAGDLAGPLAEYLERVTAHEVQVLVAPDYGAVEDDLIFGKAEAAWAPPLLTSAVVEDGGEFVLHCVRSGSVRYRGALVRRKGADASLENMGKLRAAWVSLESTGGYLLVRRWLDEHAADEPADQTFFGSYPAALKAVIDGDADFTAVFASPEGADPQRSGLDEIELDGIDQLEIFAYSPEEPNDGIVTAPGCDVVTRDALVKALSDPDDEGRAAIAKVFHAESLRPPAS